MFIQKAAVGNTCRIFVACLVSLVFVFSIAGCGGGASDGAGASSSTQPGTPVPNIENFVEVSAKTAGIVAVRVGDTAVVDGTSTTSSSQPLTYQWSFLNKPDNSTAQLQDATSPTPSFTADVAGVYRLQLQVSVEGITSQRSVSMVVVTNPGERLTGPFNHPGLSSNCVNCHDGVTPKANGDLLLHKTPDHIASSNWCQNCHTPQGFAITPFVDHQEVFGNCSECHNGTIAIGKSSGHTPTTAECDECHNTTSFLNLNPDGSFDHSNVSRVCSNCHNGKIAIGKTPTTADTPPGSHPVTTSECGYCHTTVSFLNAYPDHTGPAVTGPGITCTSCHNGTTATGQTAGHPDTSSHDCIACHNIVSFQMPGRLFNHSLLTAVQQSCESCHSDGNSINARTKSSAVPAHPQTTSDCGACHNTTSFAGAFVDHTGITTDCGVACHVADGSGTARGLPLPTPFYAHMPINGQDCSVCHTPGTFTTGTYDHAGVTSGCNACHDNRISVGKLPDHIPTNPDNQDCADCHNTTTFVGATFSHSGIVDNCASCHNGTISTGKTFNHVQTTQDCSTCHNGSSTTFTTFAGTFFHEPTVVNGNCASCHNTGVAKPKKVNHIPAQSECSSCHVDTTVGGFASPLTFLANVHPGMTSGCEGCHTSKFIPANPNVVKSASHIPTTQDCDVCHVNTAFVPSTFSHAGITGNCQSCHDGSANNVAAGALGKTPNHSPTNGQDCGACHNTVSFAGATFDHSGITSNCASCHGDNATGASTKKNPGHIPTTQDCSVCHVPGTFKPSTFSHNGIVDNCSSCHGDNSTAAVTKKSAGHVPTTQDCSLCHNTTAFAGARFDHTGIVDNCASCHDGATARGKTPPPNHVPTTQDCSVCHQTTGFVPGTFDHVGIVDNCASCHDGKFAIGKSTNHVLTNQDCSVCHTTTSFKGAGFNHTGIVDNCASCHDGVTAKGKDAKTNPPHIPTSLDCSSCHTTATFVGGTWTHDASSVGQCDTCHSPGGGARFKPSTHLNTTVQCDVCHTTNGWAPVNFKHDPNSGYPGDHRRNPSCSGCHGNTIDSNLPYPGPQFAPPQRSTVYCAACHVNNFRRKGDHIGGKNGTVEQNKNCGQSGCHSVRDWSFD